MAPTLNSSNIRNLLSLLRKAARQARETLEDLADAFPRQMNPRPSLVRVPADARRRAGRRFPNNRGFFRAGYGADAYMCPGRRFFSSVVCRGAPNQMNMMTSNINPFYVSARKRILDSIRYSTLIKGQGVLSDHFGTDPRAVFRDSSRNARLVTQHGARFLHSYHKFPTPSQAMRQVWESQVKSYKVPKNIRPMSTNQFIFPQPTISGQILAALPPHRPTGVSSIPSFSELRRAFRTQVPSTGSYVDFDITPHLTIPSVTELTESVVDQVSNDLERFAEDLKRIAKDLRQVASLGELPVSVENGKALRVYFANCEPEQVQSLLASADVTQGIVRGQSHSPILSPMEDFSDSSSYYASSTSEMVGGLSGSGDEFFYSQESLSGTEELNIPHIRGMASTSGSFVSIATPSLTNSPSQDTVSEGSSFI